MDFGRSARLGGFFFVALASPTPSQQLLWTREGSPPPSLVVFQSRATAVVQDVDGDGVDDILQNGTGLFVLSGADGSTLRNSQPFPAHYTPWSLAGAGDMDGDDRGDYVAGLVNVFCGPIGLVEARSAWDDRLLWRAEGTGCSEGFGIAVLGDLDVDGDGGLDVVVGAYREPGGGAVYVFNRDGSLRYRVAASGVAGLGYSLSKVGDIDGDGGDDFVAGSAGVVVLFSGRDGTEIVRGVGDPRSDVGSSVTGCGDLDADGLPDFAGASSAGFGVLGLVQTFSSRTGEVLRTWSHPTVPLSSSFGGRVLGSIDLDLDGIRDIVTGTYGSATSPQSVVYAFSGRDGTELMAVAGSQGSPVWPTAVMGPQPGDPFPRLVSRVPHFATYPGGSLDVGKVEVYSLRASTVHLYGSRCPGTLTTEPAIGIRRLPPATPGLRLQISNGEPGGQALLLLGLSRTSVGGLPLPYPLGGFGFSGCLLQTSIEATVPVTLGSSGLGRGYGSVDLPWALGTSLGLALHGQWLALGTGVTAPGGSTEAMSWQH